MIGKEMIAKKEALERLVGLAKVGILMKQNNLQMIQNDLEQYKLEADSLKELLARRFPDNSNNRTEEEELYHRLWTDELASARGKIKLYKRTVNSKERELKEDQSFIKWVEQEIEIL